MASRQYAGKASGERWFRHSLTEHQIKFFRDLPEVDAMPYQNAYHELFDCEVGRKDFAATRQAVASFTGEFTSGEAISKACRIAGAVDSWRVLNALDHLVTEGVLRELTNRDEVMGQDRRYVST